MEPITIFAFTLGLICGGILTAAVSINEIKNLKKMNKINSQEKIGVFKQN